MDFSLHDKMVCSHRRGLTCLLAIKREDLDFEYPSYDVRNHHITLQQIYTTGAEQKFLYN